VGTVTWKAIQFMPLQKIYEKEKNTTSFVEIMRDWADLLDVSKVNHRTLLTEMSRKSS